MKIFYQNLRNHFINDTVQGYLRYGIICLLFFLSAVSVFAQKKNSNTKLYPYGNPVIKHMYTADASPHVMPDGKVWMVTSTDRDEGGGYSTMPAYHTFSSTDMVNWTDHGEVLNIKDLIPPGTKPSEKWALWAPDMIYENGKYYLYFPIRVIYEDSVNDKGGKVTRSWIAAAVSDNPAKKFTVTNPKIEGTSGIDPAVFRDDDGTNYLLFGHQKIAKLHSNMKELAGKFTELDLGTDKFMEAIWMHKRDGKYYVSYHTKYGSKINKDNPDDFAREKSQIDYSVADNIMGPYKYGGVINFELGVNVKNGPKYPGKDYVPWRLTQSNHVGIVEYHGQDYLFYHTSALSSWRQDEFKDMGTWTQRSVCIDKMNYNKDGSIIPVQQTIEGVQKVSINQPYEISLQKGPITVTEKSNVLKFENINLGTGYYYVSIKAGNTSQQVKVEIRLSKPDGKLIGTTFLNGNGQFENTIRNATGRNDVYVIFSGVKDKIQIDNICLLAGAPKK
jgi:hypothetical protein